MSLSGPQRAAIVFAQLDDWRANALLAVLSEPESVRLLAEVARLPMLSSDDVSLVMSEFSDRALAYRQVRQGGTTVARRRLGERIGADRASEIMSELETAPAPRPLAYLDHVDPARVASFLSTEHPQVVALVLGGIDPEHAARIVDNLDEDVATDVLQRLARIGSVHPAIVEKVARCLDARLSAASLRTSDRAVDGVAVAAAVLNNVETGSEREVLSLIEASEPALAERIRSEMFVFADIGQLDDRALQTVLRSVAPPTLALAMKGAAAEVVDKVMRNMSDRAAGDLQEAVASLGPQRLSAVTAAQGAVVKTARTLADQGEIVIDRDTDRIVV